MVGTFLSTNKVGMYLTRTRQIPTLASCSFDEIVDGAAPGQKQFMQLYVNKDRNITKKIVQHAEERGIKGLFITVDAPQLGRREKVCLRRMGARDKRLTDPRIGHAPEI